MVDMDIVYVSNGVPPNVGSIYCIIETERSLKEAAGGARCFFRMAAPDGEESPSSSLVSEEPLWLHVRKSMLSFTRY